ncbi:MAG: hypothetical protein ABW123_04625 [Cystobacter sp.]
MPSIARAATRALSRLSDGFTPEWLSEELALPDLPPHVLQTGPMFLPPGACSL